MALLHTVKNVGHTIKDARTSPFLDGWRDPLLLFIFLFIELHVSSDRYIEVKVANDKSEHIKKVTM